MIFDHGSLWAANVGNKSRRTAQNELYVAEAITALGVDLRAASDPCLGEFGWFFKTRCPSRFWREAALVELGRIAKQFPDEPEAVRTAARSILDENAERNGTLTTKEAAAILRRLRLRATGKTPRIAPLDSLIGALERTINQHLLRYPGEARTDVARVLRAVAHDIENGE